MKGLLFAALVALTGTSAIAGNCLPREAAVAGLRDKYGESITGEGLVTQNGVPAILQVWMSPETGTFTIVIVRANGVACIMAAGEHWIAVEPLAALDDPA